MFYLTVEEKEKEKWRERENRRRGDNRKYVSRDGM